MILFHWCRKINIYILKTLSFRVGGGQDKLAWTAYPPGVKIIRVGGKISREILPPGGQAVQGGKINCYTGMPVNTTSFRLLVREFYPTDYKQILLHGDRSS